MAQKSESNSKPTYSIEKKEDRELFFRSCMAGDIKQVSLMLEQGFNPNITNEIGATPLIKSAKYNQLEIVKLLLAHGAVVTARNNAGWSALQYAVYNHQPDIEKLLRAAGAKE